MDSARRGDSCSVQAEKTAGVDSWIVLRLVRLGFRQYEVHVKYDQAVRRRFFFFSFFGRSTHNRPMS